MVRKVEDKYQIEADEIGIETMWKALTKEKIEFIFKVFPGLLSEAQILEGDDAINGVGLGTIFHFKYVPAAGDVPPFKERIVEWEESKHAVSFKGVEGGYLDLGLTNYQVSFKLDDSIGDGKISISTTMNYDLADSGGEKRAEEFSAQVRQYIDGLVSYLKNPNA